MEFEDHKNRIKTQLEYEKTVDTDGLYFKLYILLFG